MDRNAPPAGHVLVVDDEPLVREIASMILEREGFEVRIADSAEAALRMVDDTTTLVVSDTAMAGMSGAELREALAKSHPDLPFLLMSGMEADELPDWGVDRRDRFLSKPFTSDSLLQAVARVLAGAPT